MHTINIKSQMIHVHVRGGYGRLVIVYKLCAFFGVCGWLYSQFKEWIILN